jgi:hypothetical protein
MIQETTSSPQSTENKITFGECAHISGTFRRKIPFDFFIEERGCGTLNSGIFGPSGAFPEFSFSKKGSVSVADEATLSVYYGQILIAEIIRLVRTKRRGKIQAHTEKLQFLGLKDVGDIQRFIAEISLFLIMETFSKHNTFQRESLKTILQNGQLRNILSIIIEKQDKSSF